MRAVRFDRHGSPDVLTVQDITTPSIHRDQVLVEVHAAAVNPSDVKNVAGAMHTPPPRTPGRDFAGVVVEGPSDLLGTTVYGTGGGDLGFSRDGTHAEYVRLPMDAVVRIPNRYSMQDAAAIGVGFVTAALGLSEAGGVTSGETIAVIGSLGGVGSAVVQIAKWCGARVIGIDRRAPGQTDTVAARLDHHIDSNTSNVEATVREYTNNRGVDLVYNTVGGPLFETGQIILAIQGRHVVIASTPERHVSFDLVDFYHKRARLIGVDLLSLTASDCARILTDLAPAFDQGIFEKPRISPRAFTLDQAVQAYTAVSASRGDGRILLLPHN